MTLRLTQQDEHGTVVGGVTVLGVTAEEPAPESVRDVARGALRELPRPVIDPSDPPDLPRRVVPRLPGIYVRRPGPRER